VAVHGREQGTTYGRLKIKINFIRNKSNTKNQYYCDIIVIFILNLNRPYAVLYMDESRAQYIYGRLKVSINMTKQKNPF